MVNCRGSNEVSARFSEVMKSAVEKNLDGLLITEFCYKYQEGGLEAESEEEEGEGLSKGAVVENNFWGKPGLLIYTVGVGLMIFNRGIIEDYKSRKRRGLPAIEFRRGMILFEIDILCIMTAYAPQGQSEERKNFDATFMELQRMARKKRNKLRMLIIGGDFNGHLGGGYSGQVVGNFGSGVKQNPRGKELEEMFLEAGLVHVNSKVGFTSRTGGWEKHRDPVTFNRGSFEIDHILTERRKVHKYSGVFFYIKNRDNTMTKIHMHSNKDTHSQ